MKNVKSIFGTIVYHVHGLYLNICGAFNFCHEIMTQIPYFHIFLVLVTCNISRTAMQFEHKQI